MNTEWQHKLLSKYDRFTYVEGINKLNKRYRERAWKFFIEQKPMDLICEETGVSENRILKHIYEVLNACSKIHSNRLNETIDLIVQIQEKWVKDNPLVGCMTREDHKKWFESRPVIRCRLEEEQNLIDECDSMDSHAAMRHYRDVINTQWR